MSMARKPIFIIITGGSGSGKTTVAKLLLKGIKKCYKTETISMD
jgi:uridine kinase